MNYLHKWSVNTDAGKAIKQWFSDHQDSGATAIQLADALGISNERIGILLRNYRRAGYLCQPNGPRTEYHIRTDSEYMPIAIKPQVTVHYESEAWTLLVALIESKVEELKNRCINQSVK